MPEGDDPPQQVADSPEARSALFAARAYAGHFTRECRASARAAAFAEGAPSAAALSTLKAHMQDLRQARNDTVNKYQYYRDINPARFDWVEGRMETIGADFETAKEALLRGLAALDAAGFGVPAPPPPPPPGNAGGAAGGGGVKVQEALKPGKLHRDSLPVEVTEWRRKYTAYHRVSKFDLLEVSEQQAFFLAALDSIVATEIRQRIGADTPIFSAEDDDDDSCMSMLQTFFNEIYPLFTRRLMYFRLRQEKNQPFSEFYANLRQHGDEANLEAITVDEIYTFRILSAVADADLREELMKRREPTLQQILQDATSYTMMTRSAKAAAKADTHRTAQTSSSSSPSSCYSCGKSPRCERGRCRARNSKCHNCQQQGHWKEFNGVILCPALRRGNKQHQQQQQQQRPRTRATKQQQQSTDRTAKTVCLLTQPRRPRRHPSSSPSAPTPALLVHVEDENGRPILRTKACPDTGSTRSVISADLIKGTSARIKNESICLINASGSRMRTNGSVRLLISSPEHKKKISVDAIVSPNLRSEFLLSWHDLINLGVLPTAFPLADVSEVRRTTAETSMDAVMQEFRDVIGDDLGQVSGTMTGPPMKIFLKEDAASVRPLRVSTARPVPLHYAAAADALIDELLQAGVIVPVDTPTEWVSPAFFVPKPPVNGRPALRLVVDFSRVNACVDRPIHPPASPTDLIKKMPHTAKFFAKLDFLHGYFQLRLSEESSFLTCFLLPSGRYRFLAAPMGLCSSSDEFCRRSDEAMAGLNYVLKIVDDLLVCADTEEQLFERVREVLNRCRLAGIRVSRKKLHYGQSVKFAGFVFSDKGVSPDPAKTAAIADFPAPTNVTELRSFLGLANQLAHFMPDLSQLTSRLRELLKKDVAYLWLPEHQKDFEAVKKLLCSDMITKPFDPMLPTELYTDASRLHGLGAALVQREHDGNLRLIHCASQSLTSAQKNYSAIELEMLAIVWATEKLNFYLRGIRSFTVFTDHQPLRGVMEKPLASLDNARLCRFRQKLIDFSFEVKWLPGKNNVIADALSRQPVFAPGGDLNLDEDVPPTVCYRMIEDPAFELLFDAAQEDPHYLRLLAAVEDQRPPDADDLGPYAAFWNRLRVEGEEKNKLVVLDDSKVVVPEPARRRILQLLHAAHGGITKTLVNARQLYYWPGMRNSITQMCADCPVCVQEQPSQQSQTLQPTHASRPMEMVSLDFFHWAGREYLLMVDRLSGYLWVKKMSSTTTAATCAVLETWFVDFGYPDRIRTDNGPQFRGLFKQYCQEKGIKHETSSPYFPRSNGAAEAAVKNVKSLLKKCHETGESFEQALLAWRNLARTDGLSPAMAFFGRRQRTPLPCLDYSRFEFDPDEISDRRDMATDAAVAAFDKRAKDMSSLAVGQSVVLQDPITKDWKKKGSILGIYPGGRSYDVDVEGSIVRRNRRFLKPHADDDDQKEEDEVQAEQQPPAAPRLRRSPRLAQKQK